MDACIFHSKQQLCQRTLAESVFYFPHKVRSPSYGMTLAWMGNKSHFSYCSLKQPWFKSESELVSWCMWHPLGFASYISHPPENSSECNIYFSSDLSIEYSIIHSSIKKGKWLSMILHIAKRGATMLFHTYLGVWLSMYVWHCNNWWIVNLEHKQQLMIESICEFPQTFVTYFKIFQILKLLYDSL